MRFGKLGLCVAAGIGMASQLSTGAIIAGDHFNLSPIGSQATDLGTGVYTNGANLVGAGPGTTGYNAGTNWNFTTLSGTAVTSSGAGLNYSDSTGHSLVTSGGAIRYNGPVSGGGVDRFYRVPADQTGSTLRTTYYASVLMKLDSMSNATDQALMELKFQNGTKYVQFGLRNGKAIILNAAGASVGESQTAVAMSSGSFAAGTTHLLVLKVVGQTGNDAVSLFLDPTDLTAVDSGTPVTVTGGLDLLATAGDKVGLTGFYTGRSIGANSAYMDEVRIGTSWSDVVVAVPEPASAGLIGAVSLAGLARRRRNV